MAGDRGINPEFLGRWNNFASAARAAGFNLSIGSGYRTVSEQADLRIQNGCPDVYSSPASSCRVPTAVPGRSNHNHGLAIDIDFGANRDAAVAWAHANAAQFGLAFPIDSEDWHIEMIGDDGSFGPVNRAMNMGAIGFNVDWMESPADEDAARDNLIASYLGSMVSAQTDSLVATPEAPEIATPEADIGAPGLTENFGAEDVIQQPTPSETVTLGGQPGSPQGFGGAAGTAASGDRLGNARIIAQVGQSMGASPQQIKIALAAALVESNLINVNYGDRDSLGLFQQRPSQGWGSAQQVMDPTYAARQFFQKLLGLSAGDYGSPGMMAQAVQRSAFPGRYDERWGEANTIYGQL